MTILGYINNNVNVKLFENYHHLGIKSHDVTSILIKDEKKKQYRKGHFSTYPMIIWQSNHENKIERD